MSEVRARRSMMSYRQVITVALACFAVGCLAACTDVGQGANRSPELLISSPLAGATTSQMPVPSPPAELEAQTRRLFGIAASGNGDAETEARRSMDRGDFRFFGYSYLTPGIFPAAYGVECEPSVFARPDLVGPLFAWSDVLHELKRQIAPEANFRRFGSTYNAIILADPRFPLRHECSAVPVGDLRERPAEHRNAARQ